MYIVYACKLIEFTIVYISFLVTYKNFLLIVSSISFPPACSPLPHNWYQAGCRGSHCNALAIYGQKLWDLCTWPRTGGMVYRMTFVWFCIGFYRILVLHLHWLLMACRSSSTWGKEGILLAIYNNYVHYFLAINL